MDCNFVVPTCFVYGLLDTTCRQAGQKFPDSGQGHKDYKKSDRTEAAPGLRHMADTTVVPVCSEKIQKNKCHRRTGLFCFENAQQDRVHTKTGLSCFENDQQYRIHKKLDLVGVDGVQQDMECRKFCQTNFDKIQVNMENTSVFVSLVANNFQQNKRGTRTVQ